KGIKPSEGRRQHADMERASIHKMIERKPGAMVLAVEEVTHIIANTGQALQTAPPVEQILNLRGRHAFLRDEIEHNSGVDLSGSGAHGQTVERGEAHGAVYASTIRQGTHGSTASKVSDDYASGCHIRRDLPQPIGNILIGKAVKSITTNSLNIELLRDSKVVCKRTVAAMERRIKASNLSEIGKSFKKQTNWREIAGLMQRRERCIFLQI